MSVRKQICPFGFFCVNVRGRGAGKSEREAFSLSNRAAPATVFTLIEVIGV